MLGLYHHPLTLTSVSNLSSVLQDQRECEQAEEMNRRALAGKWEGEGARVGSSRHVDEHLLLDDLLHAMRRHLEALSLYQQSIAGYTKVLGAMDPINAACQRYRASLLEKMGLPHHDASASQ